MTQEQFLAGTPFKVKTIYNYKGDSTYYFKEGNFKEGTINKQIRSNIDERVILEDYHCNIEKIDDKGFEGYTFLFTKKVTVKYKFKDLIPYTPESVVGE